MHDFSEALQIADWRLRVFDIYARVRALSAEDPAAGHALWRLQRDELFAQHPASPLLHGQRAAFAGLAVARYDPDWRFEVDIDPARRAASNRPDDGHGRSGAVRRDRDGAGAGGRVARRLATGQLRGRVFLPVRDGLAGTPGGTYGGGRYLLDTVKGAHLGARENRLILDFNFATTPRAPTTRSGCARCRRRATRWLRCRWGSCPSRVSERGG